MELIPVIDLMDGVVVRGVAGERGSYQPNRSCLIEGHDAITTAHALRKNFGTASLYIADLDALRGGSLSLAIIQQLAEQGFQLTVDAGVTSPEQVECLLEAGAQEVVVASEALTDAEHLKSMLRCGPRERYRLSVDLKQGCLLGSLSATYKPETLVREAHGLGADKFIVLDLAAVGMGGGVSTTGLCQFICGLAPRGSVWTGGGVRDLNDLIALERNGVSGAMVASALHDGQISAGDWQTFRAERGAVSGHRPHRIR